MKVHILKINPIGNYKQESLKKPYDKILKTLLQKYNCHLLYWWEYDSKKYEAYGSIEQSNSLECNIHKLPINGYSEILEEDSSMIDLYGSIYIVKYDNNKIVDLTQEEYSEFYEITKICDLSDDSEDIHRFDEEVNIEQNKDLQQVTYNFNIKQELDIDTNDYI